MSEQYRPIDEQYDTMMEVESNPTGAWMAIQSLHATVIEQQAEIERLREASMDAAKIAESCTPSDEWAEETKDTYLFAVRDVARAIRKYYHDRDATNAHAMKEDD